MIKTHFKKVAEDHQGEFRFTERIFWLSNGGQMPELHFQLDIPYKDHQIIVNNKTGVSYEGLVLLKVAKLSYPIHFSMHTISHFKNLFLFKKDRFVVQSDNENIKYFVENEPNLVAAYGIAQKENFSPIIATSEREGRFNVTIKYHLEFDDWETVLDPLIGFCKNLADEYGRNIKNLNHKQYRDDLDQRIQRGQLN